MMKVTALFVALFQAMYLVYRALEGEPVPMSLPPPLVPPTKRKKPSVPPVMPLLPSPPSVKDSRSSHAASKTMPHPPKPAPAPAPTPAATPVSIVPARRLTLLLFVFAEVKMISNWVVQCVFQKNKKTRQSTRVSRDFQVPPCLCGGLIESCFFFL